MIHYGWSQVQNIGNYGPQEAGGKKSEVLFLGADHRTGEQGQTHNNINIGPNRIGMWDTVQHSMYHHTHTETDCWCS